MTTAKKSGPAEKNTHKLAVVLVRGMVDVSWDIKDTIRMLRLRRKNHCVVINDTPMARGMIVKAKDYVTWGPIDEKTYHLLLAKRGKEFQSRENDSKKKYQYAMVVEDGKKYKPYFALNPPRKGFCRKGIKVAFSAGGALGYRGEKMADLVQRML